MKERQEDRIAYASELCTQRLGSPFAFHTPMMSEELFSTVIREVKKKRKRKSDASAGNFFTFY